MAGPSKGGDVRLLVVRNDASAIVDRFALIHGGREVVAVPSSEEAPEGGGFDAAVVDIGSAREGLEVARRLRGRDLDCPTVVIGAEEPTGADLPDGVWLLLRPFTLADLDSRLRELVGAASEREAAIREADETDRGLLGRLFSRRSDRSEGPGSDVPPGGTSDEASAETRPGDDERSEPELQADRAEERTVAGATSPSDAEQREPRVYRRLRGTPDPDAVPDGIAEVRRAAERLVDALSRHPRLADRYRFAEHVLQETDARVVADRISMWAPVESGAYELLAATGPEPPPRSAEVAEDQQLFSEIRARSDAVLITGVAAGAGALEGIQGAHGPTLIAVALRDGPDLVGILAASGQDLRLDDRDRLAALAQRAGPQLRLAGLVETLRTDRLIVLPEGERAEGRPRH